MYKRNQKHFGDVIPIQKYIFSSVSFIHFNLDYVLDKYMCAVGRKPYRGSQQFILLGRRRYLCDVMLNKIKFDEHIFC